MPLNATVSDSRTGSPSTLIGIPPNACTFSPVAVTTTSASSSRPDSSSTPRSVKVRIRSVTTAARPPRIALNRSPSGTAHSRWSHGSYGGQKCSSTG